LKVTAYSRGGAKGKAGAVVTVNFMVVNGIPTPTPTPTAVPTNIVPLVFKSTLQWQVPYSPHDPNDPATPLWNYKGYTYFVWIDQDLHPVVHKVKNGVLIEKSYLSNNGYMVNPDAHGRFSMGIDRQGYIHIIGDMHNYTGYKGDTTFAAYKDKQVLYWKSNAPENVAQGFTFAGDRNSSTALDGSGWITACAYFFTDNNGELYYTSSVHAIETGGPGKVGVGLYKYSTQTKSWTNIGAMADKTLDPSVERHKVFFWEKSGFGGGTNWFQNFHPRFVFDQYNTMHFVVSANNNPAVPGADRVIYAQSSDGAHWKKANGQAIAGLPIRAADQQPNQGDIVASDVRQEANGYFSPTVSVIVDRNGKIGVGVNQIWRTWNGSQWSKSNSANNANLYANFAYRMPDRRLVFISGMDMNVINSFDEKPTTYSIPAALRHTSGQFSIDDLGLRMTGALWGVVWDSSTRIQTLIRTTFR
jgi:hypothetical protein